MRLTTPPAIRTLQRKLYVKAKTEPTKLPGRGTRRYTAAQVFERDGLFHLGAAYRAARSHALA